MQPRYVAWLGTVCGFKLSSVQLRRQLISKTSYLHLFLKTNPIIEMLMYSSIHYSLL